MGTSGSVDYMFQRKCVFKISAEGIDLEELEFDLIDHGLEEAKPDEEGLIELTAAFEDFGNLQKALEERALEVKESELVRIPDHTTTLSEDQVEEVIKLIDNLKVDHGQVAISSFYHHYLDTAQHLRPEIEINALIGGGPSGRNNWGNFGYQTYNANADYIDHGQVMRALEHGCTVNLYTVNDPDMMQTFIDRGVSSLITDYPQTLRKILKR